MKRKNPEQRYRNATLAIYFALQASSSDRVNLPEICKAHQISQSYPATMRRFGFITGPRNAPVWNPDCGMPSDDNIESMRVSHLQRMVRKKPLEPKAETPAPKVEPIGRLGRAIEQIQHQAALPLEPADADRFVEALEELHQATGKVLEVLGRRAAA